MIPLCSCPPASETVQLLTTDALVEGIHFDLSFTSLRHVGWKALLSSFSDIAAIGGRPLNATISIPQKISIEMIDISDGLASEIHHLCRSSGLGAVVYEHNLTMISVTQAIASEFNGHSVDYALDGSEEYELLIIITDKDFEVLETLPGDTSIIGRTQQREEGLELVGENGEHTSLRSTGWNHFPRS